MMFMSGSHIGFFQGDVKKLVGDIQELKPTIFISVPRLLNRIYDKVKRHRVHLASLGRQCVSNCKVMIVKFYNFLDP